MLKLSWVHRINIQEVLNRVQIARRNCKSIMKRIIRLMGYILCQEGFKRTRIEGTC